MRLIKIVLKSHTTGEAQTPQGQVIIQYFTCNTHYSLMSRNTKFY